MDNELLKSLVDNPGVVEARLLVANLQKKGFLVLVNPETGAMIVGNNTHHKPCPQEIKLVADLHHEIALLFAVQTLGMHYQSIERASKFIYNLKLGILANGSSDPR